MEKFKYTLNDTDYQSLMAAHAAAVKYYSRKNMNVFMEMDQKNILSVGQSNLPLAWKLLREYVDFVTLEEAKVADLRSRYVKIREFLDIFERDFGRKDVLTGDTNPDIHYANVFGGDVMKFAFYLVAADGKLALAETQFIEGVLNMGLTQEFTLELIQNSGIMDEEDRKKYESSALKSLNIALISDRYYLAHPMGSGITDLTDKIILFFKHFGETLVGIDGEESPEETESIEKLLKNFRTVSEAFATSIKG